MKQDRIDQTNSVQVQAQDPIGVIAGQATRATLGHPNRDLVSVSSIEIAWAIAH
ncbi:hypothetical protein [Beijerinckia sp. L45]|uniref:hypothetical protein n=1 Tax=Beijerinckia sp. L45 TaxID=1641855 RepID=UPI00131B4F53|nr:hypothetical protein [Beijerinckia sp. L45]